MPPNPDIDWSDLDKAREDLAPDRDRPSQIGGTPWGLVGQEYGQFHRRTKTFIRWAILVIGVFFALNYASAQITSTICHWVPNSDYFCNTHIQEP